MGKEQRGITLIALVITIIVLLILAGVSISLVVGENGVLTQATSAVEENDKAEEGEKVRLAAAASIYTKDLKVKKTLLEKELDNAFGSGKYTLEEKTGYYEITIKESSRKYKVDSYGSTKLINDEEETLDETNAKYFDFTYDETTKTAVLTGIKEEYIPSITVYDKTLGEDITQRSPAYIQDNEKKITEISIPASVTLDGEKYIVNAIGDNAFYCFFGKSEITNIIIPDSVISIGEKAFSSCGSLTEITIPHGVTSISKKAFSGCSSLTEIEIPHGVTSIGHAAFSSCGSLTEITIPNSVTSIDNQAFQSSGLIEITIPNSVKSIGDFIFYSCYSLSKITIQDGLTSIGSNAFFYCTNLTEITIPNSVTSIGGEAFSECSNLKDIYCEVETQPNTWDSNWSGSYTYPTVHWGSSGPTDN